MRRHKIVLYNPQAVFYTMPLAVLAVGSALDSSQYEVQIVDGRLERDATATLIEQVPEALCLGISVLSGAPIRDALRVTRAVKTRHPDVPVVWGGWHPSLFPIRTLEGSEADVTVVGQGERTFAQLVDRLARKETLDGLPGTALGARGEPIVNPPRPLSDANTLPAHDYGLIPVEAYFQRKGRRQLDYVSSVGCRFRCAFCADSLVYGRRWMGLDAERVESEIAHLWRRHRFDDLSFQDEAFFTDQGRVAAIAEGFLRRELHFSWRATLRADQGARLGDAVLSLCRRSGLSRALVGVESGSQEMLDRMTKDLTVGQVVACAEKLLRHDIGATFSFIVGLPDEPDASIEATLQLVKRLRSMSPRFETPIFYYKPYPGSSFSRQAVDRDTRRPQTLEAWAEFDYIGSPGPWVSAEKQRLIERFKFYNRFAWGRDGAWCWPLRAVARWRCLKDEYRLPWEKTVVEGLRPPPRVS